MAPSVLFEIVRKRQFKKISWALTDQALVSAVNFTIGILLARFLGLEGYGIFALAWMAVLFVNSLQNALIVAPMLSIGPTQTYRAKEYFGSVLLQQFLFSGGSFLVVWMMIELSGIWLPVWRLNQLSLPLAFVAATFQLQDFLRRYFFAVEREIVAFFNDLICYVGQIVGLIVCVGFVAIDAATALWVIAGSSSLAAITGLVYFGKPEFKLETHKEVVVRHWNFSKWLVASSLMSWVSGNLFTVVASAHFGPIAAGAIRATQNIIGVAHILFQGLSNFVPVEAARAFYQGGSRDLCRFVGRVSLWGGLATGLLALAAITVPKLWLELLYGSEYLNYSYVLRWWGVIYFVIFFGVPLTAGLRALECTRPIFFANGIMTIFSVVLALPVVTHLGMHGAMAGIFVSQIILQGLIAFSFWRRSQRETA